MFREVILLFDDADIEVRVTFDQVNYYRKSNTPAPDNGYVVEYHYV